MIYLSEARATVEEVLGGSVEIRAKLGKGSDLTVLGKLELERGGDLLHGLGLGSGADTGHGETDVDGGADTLKCRKQKVLASPPTKHPIVIYLEEEIGLKENLAVSDGNDVGGNVGRHITSLGLDDGEGSHGSTLEVGVELGGTLEETRVEVEHITGVSLTTRGTCEKIKMSAFVVVVGKKKREERERKREMSLP